MTKRAHISLEKQLAAALLVIGDIAHEHAKQMTARQIISLFHLDHYPIPKAEDGPDEPWNMMFRFIGDHRQKTRKIDIPQIAKNKRITADQIAFRRRILAKGNDEPKPKSKWPSRPFPKRGKAHENIAKGQDRGLPRG